MATSSKDSLNCESTLTVSGKNYQYFDLNIAAQKLGDISRLPTTLKVLLENMLRHEDGSTVSVDDAQAIVSWQDKCRSDREIAYRPARVLMQDFTGVPAVVDLAAMRGAMEALGGDAKKLTRKCLLIWLLTILLWWINLALATHLKTMLIWK